MSAEGMRSELVVIGEVAGKWETRFADEPERIEVLAALREIVSDYKFTPMSVRAS